MISSSIKCQRILSLSFQVHLSSTTAMFQYMTQYKRSLELSHRLNNRHLAASEKYYCQKFERIIDLIDGRDHSESEEKKPGSMVL